MCVCICSCILDINNSDMFYVTRRKHLDKIPAYEQAVAHDLVMQPITDKGTTTNIYSYCLMKYILNFKYQHPLHKRPLPTETLVLVHLLLVIKLFS